MPPDIDVAQCSPIDKVVCPAATSVWLVFRKFRVRLHRRGCSANRMWIASMTAPQEKRQFGRRESAPLAWIRIGGRRKLQCVVSTFSEFEAFLELTPPDWLPFLFTLELTRDGQLFGCETRHTRKNGVKVVFVPVSEVVEFEKKVGNRPRTEEEDWRGDNRLDEAQPTQCDDGQARNASLVKGFRASLTTKRSSSRTE